MATKKYKVRGTCSWAQVFEGNRDKVKWDESSMSFVSDPEGGNYKITLHLEMDQFKSVKKTGSKVVQYSKEDDVGLDTVVFKRPHVKKDRKGEVLEWAGGAPQVTDEFDEAWNFEEKGPIYDGSEVEVEYVVYGKSPMVGTRLESVKVLKSAAKPTDMEDEVAF